MIISEEQVRRAVEYLHTSKVSHTGSNPHTIPSGVSPELIERVRRSLAEMPDLRDDRVAHGREMLEHSPLSGSAVAEKMIGRIISDSIR